MKSRVSLHVYVRLIGPTPSRYKISLTAWCSEVKFASLLSLILLSSTIKIVAAYNLTFPRFEYYNVWVLSLEIKFSHSLQSTWQVNAALNIPISRIRRNIMRRSGNFLRGNGALSVALKRQVRKRSRSNRSRAPNSAWDLQNYLNFPLRMRVQNTTNASYS